MIFYKKKILYIIYYYNIPLCLFLIILGKLLLLFFFCDVLSSGLTFILYFLNDCLIGIGEHTFELYILNNLL